MRKSIMIMTLLATFTGMCNAQAERIDAVRQPLSSSISYKWDLVNGSWVATTKNIYSYTDDWKTSQTLSVNLITGEPVSRTVYVYNLSGKLDEYYSQSRIDGAWVLVRKYDLEYGENGKTESMVVTDWKNGVLVYNRRQTDYTYNELGLNTIVQYQAWSGSEWINSVQENYFYDENRRLIRSESFNPEGIPVNRIFYESNNNSLRIKMLVQSWSKGLWVDVYRDQYTYDDCGQSIDFVRQNFTGGAWINLSKVQYFRELYLEGFGPGQLIAVCHKGHTIYVSKNAVEAHLAHGDCLGKCLDEDIRRLQGSDRNDGNKSAELQVWPNPSADRMTVKLRDAECSMSKIEIADMFGNIVRVINAEGEKEVTLSKGNLLSGSYVMRVHSDQVYSLIIIFN